MLKLAVAAAAAVLLTPAVAHAATHAASVRGTVVAKERARLVLVMSTPRGHVNSVRVTLRQLRSVPVGARIVAKGTRLADHSLRAIRLARLGQATKARLRVMVVRANAGRLLVAGGGSAFAIRLKPGTRVPASAGRPQPGQEIEAEVEVRGDGDTVTSVQTVGDSPLIDFSGKVTAIDTTSFTVTTDGIATVVQLPDGVVLPPLVQVGTRVEIVASISGSTLTLVTIKLDDESSNDGNGSSVDEDGGIEVEGTVTAFDSGSITIQPGDDGNATPVVLTIPTGFTLPALTVGEAVEAKGQLVDGVLTLSRLEVEDDSSGSDSGGDGDSSGGSGLG